MTASLEYLGGKTILLGDGTHRWIKLKRFRLETAAPPGSQDIVATLLAHPAYRDDLAHFDDGSVSSLSVAADPIHGPFSLGTLSPGSFEQIAAPRAVQILDEWIEEGRTRWRDGGGNPTDMPPIQDDVVEAIQHVSHQINEALIRFHLREQPLRGIVGKQGFHEFILVGSSDEVTLAIAADD